MVLIRTFHTAPEQGQGRMGYVHIFRSRVLMISQWLSDVLGAFPASETANANTSYTLRTSLAVRQENSGSATLNLHLVIIFTQYNIGTVPLGTVFTDHHS